MSVWYDKIELEIEDKNEGLYKKDFKFYQVDTFLKLAKKIDELSDECSECKLLKTKVEEVSGNLDVYLNGEIASRRNYEKILNEIFDHVKKKHKIFPKQHNLYSFSFFGIIAGLGIGWLIGWLIGNDYVKGGLIFGFTIGLIAGRIIGKVRDKNLLKEGRILD